MSRRIAANETGGTAAIWGRDIDKQPRDARAALGVVPQEIVADVFFTPREALEVQAVVEPDHRTGCGAVGLGQVHRL